MANDVIIYGKLKLSEYNDFLTEYPSKTVDFISSMDKAHDRYIIIDKNTAGMQVPAFCCA